MAPTDTFPSENDKLFTFQASPDFWIALSTLWIKNLIVLKEPLETVELSGSANHVLGVYLQGASLVAAISIPAWLGLSSTPNLKHWISCRYENQTFAIDAHALGDIYETSSIQMHPTSGIYESMDPNKLRGVFLMPKANAVCGVLDETALFKDLCQKKTLQATATFEKPRGARPQ